MKLNINGTEFECIEGDEIIVDRNSPGGGMKIRRKGEAILNIRDGLLSEVHKPRRFLAPILDKEFTPSKANPDIITGHWQEDDSKYIIKCPAQLRDVIVYALNNLGKWVPKVI